MKLSIKERRQFKGMLKYALQAKRLMKLAKEVK